MQRALELDPSKLARPPEALQAARRMGDAAIAAGAAKARTIDPSFIESASAHMLAYLRVHGTSSGELLTDSCKLAGITSTSDKHFGAVIQALLRSKSIVWAGDCKRTKGHASRGGSLYSLASGSLYSLADQTGASSC